MKYSLRTKLSLSYILVALICVALISFLTNYLVDKQFQSYIKNNLEQENKSVVATITQQYQANNNWNMDLIESIGIAAIENGLIIKIKDKNGKMIWDATVHNNGMCEEILKKMASNMENSYPSLKGGYVEKIYPILYEANTVGSIDIGYYGPFFLNDNDMDFISRMNRLFIVVGIFSLIFALVLGFFMARRLSTPIAKVINTAEMISKGFFNNRIHENPNTKEMSQLTETVNHLAETLGTQESLRKRLTADVAHELRTPIATLQGHMEAMIDGIWEPDAKRLNSCHEEIMRIGRLVDNLGKLEKYENENLTLDKTEFDISKIISRILQNFESQFISKSIEVAFIERKEFLYADQDKVSQVIVNLLSNALKYTQESGRVEITVKSKRDHVEIVVKDNGQGISVKDLPYVFERFYRVDKSRNRLTGGAGIGLTIVKAIVEAHMGEISVQSEINVGSQFVVVLPKHMK
ncbi:MAG: two-component sensor histidine kinase [Firmicutes bacterium HGW-Firmicutes-1]|nr:MAG: two-component sensor histidine kinase [Firmicutes bacterium HGW-Firmicutes-1]